MIKEKRWNKEMEAEIIQEWKQTGKFRFKRDNRPVFSIDTPPPYINTPVHMGHATTYTLMDMFARFQRMLGKNVLFPLGLDRNGLPIEVAAEKKFNIKLTETPRKDFIEKCKKILEKTSSTTADIFLRLGHSYNSWQFGKEIGDAYKTDSDEYRALTQATFIEMWNKGLIYEDERINNYCPGCKTTVADSEIEYEERQSTFNDIKFRVKETGEEIVIGTTRPELIPSCGMIIFNPEDKRYGRLEGMTAITPIFEKEVPIKAHPQADIDKGTGLVMMCSAGDISDIRFFREEELEPIISIGIDGRMNENAGFLEGLTVREAREKIVNNLKELGLIANSIEVSHRTPICERSKDEIEFIEMKEFYLKQVEFIDTVKELTKDMSFYSEQSRKILDDWMNSVSADWPISRRRYYATEIPIWYCKECNEPYLPEPGRYYRPWKELPPPKSECGKCGNEQFIGEERVFDTWFDSSISELYVLGYGRDNDFFHKSYPCTLRPQGKEIVRTWLYYTILRGYHLTSKPAFNDVWIHHHITDEDGYKMSKSKGNVIDPQEVLDKYGAEPFRLWTVLEGNITQGDFKCSFERIESNMKTLVKIWNVCRFISQFDMPDAKPKKREIDLWILREANNLAKYARERYEVYDFHNPAVKIRHFIWETFASHYMEIIKSRAYNDGERFKKDEQAGAVETLNEVLDIILKLWSPVIPMATHKLYESLRGKDIQDEPFPEYQEIKTDLSTDDIVEFNSIIWKLKRDAGKSLREELSDAIMKKSLESVEDDLKVAHNIKNIEYD